MEHQAELANSGLRGKLALKQGWKAWKQRCKSIMYNRHILYEQYRKRICKKKLMVRTTENK